MKVDIFRIDDFIDANKCKEVTNPIFFDFSGQPTPDGLFSYNIFGYSDEERKNIFAYIDLQGHYIHPLCYLILIKKMGSLGKVVLGEKYAVIADKKIKIVPPDFNGAETGIDFLYDHFEEIDWINELEEDEIDSLDKKTRLKFIKSLKKDEFFVTKWLVLPPFYRAESSTNRSMGDDINKLYKELISKVRSSNLGFSFDVFSSETKLRIQNILKDLYLSTTAPISGKHLNLDDGTLKGTGKTSMLRKHLIAKNVDWSASSVITAPVNSDANKPEDKPVPFGYSCFPLAILLSMFQPFYLGYCSDFLESLLAKFANEYINEIQQIDIGQFNSEEIEKLIKRFIKDPQNRFEPIKFKYKNKSGVLVEKVFVMYEYKNREDAEKGVNYFKHPLTLTEMLYFASLQVLSDKHVFTTRFPIESLQSIYPSRIKILTTRKTKAIYFTMGANSTPIYYDDRFPTIPGSPGARDIDTEFYDVTLIGNQYIAPMGADYDGDMVYMRAVFSKEANDEADRLIWAKSNYFTPKGELSRGVAKIGKDAILGLFELTKEME